MLHFRIVEIDSNIIFKGSKAQTLKYCVRSITILSFYDPGKSGKELPEIFWQ